MIHIGNHELDHSLGLSPLRPVAVHEKREYFIVSAIALTGRLNHIINFMIVSPSRRTLSEAQDSSWEVILEKSQRLDYIY